MTEDEAKTKWCPQARIALWHDGCAAAANRMVTGETHRTSNCIASQCMAWRTTSSQHGYCGLAGRPRV